MKPLAVIYKPVEDKSFESVLTYELREGDKRTMWLQMPSSTFLKTCFKRGIKPIPESLLTGKAKE